MHSFRAGLRGTVAENRSKIQKFGGSSLADAACFRLVAGIILDNPETRHGVLVSAMGGMTDAHIHLPVIAERDDHTNPTEYDKE